MGRYFRERGFDSSGAGWKNYRAVATEPDTPLAGSAYGEVGVVHKPGFNGPVWDNGDNRGKDESTRHLSEATGVSHELIKHLSDFNDPNMSHEDTYAISKIVNNGDTHRTAPEDFARAVSVINNHPMVTSGKLFGEQRGTVEVSSAHFDKHANHLFPTMMSIIKQDHLNADIVPSSNLSPYSSRIAKNAVERGLIQPNEDNPESNQENSIGFDTKIVTPFDEKHMGIYLYGEVGDKDVRVARGALRDELKRNRRSKMSAQFSQEDFWDANKNMKIPSSWPDAPPKLPGLEDY